MPTGLTTRVPLRWYRSSACTESRNRTAANEADPLGIYSEDASVLRQLHLVLVR